MGLLNFLKGLMEKEDKFEEKVEFIIGEQELFIDEEDRLVVALAASALAGKDKPNSHFHISKITRIK